MTQRMKPTVKWHRMPKMGWVKSKLLYLVGRGSEKSEQWSMDSLQEVWKHLKLLLIRLCTKTWSFKFSEQFHPKVSKSISSVTQSCPTLCDPMNCSMPGLPVHHQLPEFTQTHVHRVGDAIQPSHPLLSPSPALNLSQQQGLFKWVSSSHQVAKVLEFQLQHQSFQWTPRTDLWDGLVGSPCSPRDSQELSPTPQFKSINSLALSLLYSPTLTSIHDYLD